MSKVPQEIRLRDEENRLANLEPEELASNEVATVLPWLAGEAKLPARWLSPVYKPFTRKVNLSGAKK